MPEGSEVELMEADSVMVALALLLAWLAVPLLLPLAEREAQLAVAEEDCVALSVGVWETEGEDDGLVTEGREEPEGSEVALEEAVTYVALALMLAWLAVPELLPLAEGEGQLAVAEAVCDTLIVGVWEAVRQRVGVGEVHGETESEGLFEALTETVRECEALALLLAWLAVMEPLPVAEGESQLAVAEADSVPFSVGV